MKLVARLALLAAVLGASPASAYVRSQDNGTGVCLFWTRREVPWFLNVEGSLDAALPDVQAALERSFDAWRDVACSDISFRSEGLTARRELGFDENRNDNINLVAFRETSCADFLPTNPSVAPDACFAAGDCPEVLGCWDHGSAIIALTTTVYSRSLGFLVDGDIEFNGSPDALGQEFRFTATEATGPGCQSPGDTDCVDTDLQNTATHEIGHLLGFEHSPERDATMFASAPRFEVTKRSLHEDDIEALCDVYPANAPVLTCTPSGSIGIAPTGPASNGCGCGGAAGGFAALGLLAAWLGRKRL